MLYVKFGPDGRVTDAGNDSTLTELPEGAFEVSGEQFAARFDLLRQNDSVIVSPPGPTPETEETARVRALTYIRFIRPPMLAALSGVAGMASRRGDADIAQSADDAAQALLEIQNLPAFLAATTYEGMQVAVLTRYAQIVSTTHPTVQEVVREVLGK